MTDDTSTLRRHLNHLASSAETAELRQWANTALQGLEKVTSSTNADEVNEYDLPLKSNLFYSAGNGTMLAIQVPEGTTTMTGDLYWSLLAQRLQWMMEREGNDDDMVEMVLEMLAEAGLGGELHDPTFAANPNQRGQMLVDCFSIRSRLWARGMNGSYPDWPEVVDSEQDYSDVIEETTMEEWLANLLE